MKMDTHSGSDWMVFAKDKLTVRIFRNRADMGAAAAAAVSARIQNLLRNQAEVNIILGSAPSQNEFMDGLAADPAIDWKRIRAFHMDEYIGLSPEDASSFGYYLKKRLFEKVAPKSVFFIDGKAADLQAECRRYAGLLREHPTDISCLGVGENGHIAFNDPHVALFQDPVLVKVVQMDEPCRLQQVHDRCFERLELVPTQAITLTVPALIEARHVFCVVPARAKANAILHMLQDEVSEKCPASVLRTKEGSVLFLDPDSSEQIRKTIGDGTV